ncbi:hypothetical protein GJAV_G00047770 [Gymnothorax javanicus]|nr:hypothetical protein GJAV_G00047770 [Gymnothorax javanicus]
MHPPDIASMPSVQLLRHMRGEHVLRQVAEMEEEEEQMTPCLRPYKNGLLYKTRMWAKNRLENTLENYLAYQEEEAARLRESMEWESEGSEELQFSMGSEEEMEEIASLAEALNAEDERYYSRSPCIASHVAHIDKHHAYRDKKRTSKGKIGCWVPEAILSPVEEPSDEYVDPMDELQCLVETVSEYLAEKEEEINKYGSLPKSNKSRLSSQGSARTDSTGDEQSIASKQTREETTPESVGSKLSTSGEQGISGVKSAVSSFFSSFTEKVGSGSKQPPESTDASAPAESGISKLLSFIPKSPSPTPLAVVPPGPEPAPDRKFSLQSLLPFQTLDSKDTGSKSSDARQEAKPDKAQFTGEKIQEVADLLSQLLSRSHHRRLTPQKPLLQSRLPLKRSLKLRKKRLFQVYPVTSLQHSKQQPSLNLHLLELLHQKSHKALVYSQCLLDPVLHNQPLKLDHFWMAFSPDPLEQKKLQEEKPVAVKEESTAASVFGKKLGFPWQKDTPEAPKSEEAPVITTQPKSADGKFTETEKANPVDSSRFGSSGNLSQASSQLSETGPDSAAGSELEERRDQESYHSYHSTGSYRPANGLPAWNQDEDTRTPAVEPSRSLNGTPQTARSSPVQPSLPQEKKLDNPARSFLDDGPPPFSPSRVRWLKAINKVRVQLQEVGSAPPSPSSPISPPPLPHLPPCPPLWVG